MSPKRRRWLRWAIVALVLLVVAAGCGVGGLAGLFWFYGRDIEAIDETALRNYKPPQVTRIYARDGRLIGELFSERRTVIKYDAVPAHVEDAFLAAEDADFYRHEGMDYLGMVRALFVNVRAGEVRQGASTITQQVVKNFILSPERTLERKVQELILARRLEQVLSKREILSLYLNDIYLGHGRYGIEEASQHYFGKSVREVDLGQAALLATLPKAPSAGSPFVDAKKAKTRQVWVLRQMAKRGFCTPEDAQRYIAAPLELVKGDAGAGVHEGASEFVDVARTKLVERYGEAELDSLGAKVTMTVDLGLQEASRKSLFEGLVALDQRRGYGHKIKPAKEKNLERARNKGAGSLAVGNVYPIVIEACPEGAPPEGFCGKIGEHATWVSVPEGSRYDEPDKTHAEQFVEGGITMARVRALEPNERHLEKGVPAGAVVAEVGSGPEATTLTLSVETGEVLAMVGGSRYGRGDFNRAMQARRQPGSSFKPFVYGAALQSRRFSPATLVSDSPEIYEKWKPTNFERDKYRGDIRLRVALTESVNTVAIKLLDAVGFDETHAFARAAGIESELGRDLSLALGTSEVTPFELARSYLTLARGGSRLEPRFIESIEVPGEEIELVRHEEREALEAEVVYVLVSMMRSVVEEGTGQRAKALGRPAAGKTGTSAEGRDAWFAGFTPRHVAVAWVGFDNPKPMRRETGGRAAAPIWLGAMKAAEAGTEALEFAALESVAVRTIDKRTGLLAPPPEVDELGQPREVDPETLMEEVFVPGTEPVEHAPFEVADREDVLLDLYGGGDESEDELDEALDGEAELSAMVGGEDEGPIEEPAEEPEAQPDPDPPAREEPGLPGVDD